MKKKRKSIITDYMEISAFSGKPTQCFHHCIYGNGLHELADQDSLAIPLTHEEHNMGALTDRIHGNSAAEHLSRMVGQLAWEKHYLAQRLASRRENFTTDEAVKKLEDESREAFRKRYSISYL